MGRLYRVSTPEEWSEEFFDGGEASVLARAWPEGPSVDDRLALLTMAGERRADAIRRIDALVAYEAGGATGAAEYAERAGMKTARFYALLKEWRAERSVRSVAPHAGPRRILVRQRQVDPRFRAVVKDVLGRRPDATKEAVALEIARLLGPGAPALSRLREIVGLERAAVERVALGGDRGFGRRTAIDATGLSLPVGTADGGVAWAVAGFVFDVATGWIAGAVVGDGEGPGRGLYRRTAEAAADALRSLELPVAGDIAGAPEFTVVIGEENPVVVLREVNRLAGVPFKVRAVVGERRHGSELRRLLGKEVGGIELLARYANAGFAGRRPAAEVVAAEDRIPLSLADAAELLARAVAAHNAAVLARGPEAAIGPSVVADAVGTLF